MKKRFYFQVIVAKCEDWSKAPIVNISAYRKMWKKNKVHYLLQLQKIEKIMWSYFSQFWPWGGDIDDFDQYSCLAEIICKENPCTL